jgi:hypothetical protein
MVVFSSLTLEKYQSPFTLLPLCFACLLYFSTAVAVAVEK